MGRSLIRLSDELKSAVAVLTRVAEKYDGEGEGEKRVKRDNIREGEHERGGSEGGRGGEAGGDDDATAAKAGLEGVMEAVSGRSMVRGLTRSWRHLFGTKQAE